SSGGAPWPCSDPSARRRARSCARSCSKRRASASSEARSASRRDSWARARSSPIRFDAAFALAGCALALSVALAAAVLPVIEALRTPPLQNLKRERPLPLSSRARLLAIGVAIAFAVAAGVLALLPAVDGLPIAALAAALCVLGALFAL